MQWGVFLAVALLSACALAQQPPRFDRYTMDFVFSLPYNGISEPVRVYYDAAHNKSRTEYYNGQDVYIFRPDMFQFGTVLQIVPVTNQYETNEPTCFQNNGSYGSATTIQSAIPDLSVFTNASSLAWVRGVECQNWTYTFTEYGRTNYYHFYISVVSGAPIQYHMFGYDTLYGSHYDEYILNYNTFDTSPIDQSLFEPPVNMDCGAFPGPGASHNARGALMEIEDIPTSHKMWDSRFEAFKSKHGKSYANHAEHQKRKDNFRHNYRFIEATNHQQLTYKVAVNHLADYTHEERLAMLGRRSSRTPAEIEARKNGPKTKYTGPSSWDWRTKGAVTYVKDQGMCGSCWSFGTAESIEGAWFLKTGNLIPISEQAFMDCSWGYGNNACDGGEAFRAYQWAIDNGGNVPSEASYGLYQMADGLCHAFDDDIQPGATITGYVNVTSDVDSVLAALYSNGPLAVAIDASHPAFSFYSSGVYYEPTCGNTDDDLDHEVLAVGFGTAAVGGDYWIVKNSWSQYWGMEGFVYMSRVDNNCGVATDANYPLV